MMKLPDKYIVDLTKNLVGDDAVKLVLLIKDKENFSEFKIAEKMNITVNEVRSVLYRLNEKGLVDSTRKKDKKKGWYVYYWTFDHKRALSSIVELKTNEINELKKRIELESNAIFYVCPNKCMRVNAENALELQFKCTECSSILTVENKEERFSKIKDKVKKLENELNEILQLKDIMAKKAIIEEEKRKEKEKIKRKDKIKPKIKFRFKVKEKIKKHRKIKIEKKKEPKKEIKQKSKLALIKKPSLISRLKRKFIRR